MQSSPAIRREVGPFALMLTGLGSIIGSGWLFGAWRAAGLAGPDAIWAWVIGAAVITTIALTYAELGAMFPESGGMVRMSQYSHGSLVGFIGAWSNWIAIVSVIPVEAEASVQYMAGWDYQWAKDLYMHAPGGKGELTPPGIAIAAVLVIVYFLLNFWSVKIFARSNTAITVFKLVVPALAAITLIASGFHSENFSVGINGGPHTMDLAAVLTAVATAGIVFSYNGFQSPVNLAGEARDPERSIPFAIFGSIALATVVYLLLQTAYLGAVPQELLAKAGWHGIDFSSPFADLAKLLGIAWLANLLFFDAFISPSGTGITYTATTARMLFGMQRNGTMPKIFGTVHNVWGVPRAAMWFNLAVSYVFLFFFRGWGTLAAVISVATIISYLTGPVSAMTLAPYRAGSAPSAAHARAAGARLSRLRVLHRTFVLGEMAADRRDHPADRRGAADLLLFPGAQAVARLPPAARRRVVADRVPADHRVRLVCRQHALRRHRLAAVRMGSRRRRAGRPGVLLLGTALRLAHAGHRRHRPSGPERSRGQRAASNGQSSSRPDSSSRSTGTRSP